MKCIGLHCKLEREAHSHNSALFSGLYFSYSVRKIIGISCDYILSVLNALSTLTYIYFWLLVTTAFYGCNQYSKYPTNLDDSQASIHLTMTEAGLAKYIARGLDFSPKAIQSLAGFEKDLELGVVKIKVSDVAINELSVEKYKVPLAENSQNRYLEFTGLFVEIQLKVVVSFGLSPMTAVLSIGVPYASGYAAGQVSITDRCPHHIAMDIDQADLSFDEITLRIIESDSPLLQSVLPSFKPQLEAMIKGNELTKIIEQATAAIRNGLESADDYVLTFYEKPEKRQTMVDVRYTGFIWGRNLVTLKAGGYTYQYFRYNENADGQVYYAGNRETKNMPIQLNEKDWQFIIDISAFRSNLDVSHRSAQLYDVQFRSDDLKAAFGKLDKKGHLMVNVTNNESPTVQKVGGAGLKCSFNITAKVWLTKSETDTTQDEYIGSLRLEFNALAAVSADLYMWEAVRNTTIIYPSFEQITDIKGEIIKDDGSLKEKDQYWYKEIGAALETDYFGAIDPILRKSGLTWANLNFANFSSLQVVYFPESLVLVSGNFFDSAADFPEK